MKFYEENIEYLKLFPSFPQIFDPRNGSLLLGRYFRKNRHGVPPSRRIDESLNYALGT